MSPNIYTANTFERLRSNHAQPYLRLFLDDPQKDAIELDMSVDTALKYVVSMGVVAPEMAAKTNSSDKNNPNNVNGEARASHRDSSLLLLRLAPAQNQQHSSTEFLKF